MDNILFLENCDLLDAVNIQNAINESNELELLEQVVTEQDMMIALYEHQRFMVEQDTQVFMRLKYEPVNEAGLLKKIGQAILSVLKKIKELIMKFINFITGKRKKENYNDMNKKSKETSEKIKKVSKDCEDSLKEMQKSEYNNDSVYKNIDEIEKEIDKIQNDKKFIRIDTFVEKEAFKFNNTFKDLESIPEVKTLFDAVDEALSILQNESKLSLFANANNNDEFRDIFKSNGYNAILKVKFDESDKYDRDKFLDICDVRTSAYDYNSEEFISLDEYLNKYFNKNDNFFKEYPNDCMSNLSTIKNTLNQKIIPIENKVKNLESKYNNDDVNENIRRIYNSYLHSFIYKLSEVYNYKIQQLVKIERVYNNHCINIQTMYSYLEKLENMQKIINKMMSEKREMTEDEKVKRLTKIFKDKVDEKRKKYE